MKVLVIVILALIAVSAVLALRPKPVKTSPLLEAGRLLFPDHRKEFDAYFNLFLADKKKFLSEYDILLQGYDNFEINRLKPIEALCIFGDSRKLLGMTDWKGEENEKEVESFLEQNLGKKVSWSEAIKLREAVSEDAQRDGKFIIDLFKSLDRDLQAIDKRLIFLDLGWDAYVYTPVSSRDFEEIIKISPGSFFGVEKLKE